MSEEFEWDPTNCYYEQRYNADYKRVRADKEAQYLHIKDRSDCDFLEYFFDNRGLPYAYRRRCQDPDTSTITPVGDLRKYYSVTKYKTGVSSMLVWFSPHMGYSIEQMRYEPNRWELDHNIARITYSDNDFIGLAFDKVFLRSQTGDEIQQSAEPILTTFQEPGGFKLSYKKGNLVSYIIRAESGQEACGFYNNDREMEYLLTWKETEGVL